MSANRQTKRIHILIICLGIVWVISRITSHYTDRVPKPVERRFPMQDYWESIPGARICPNTRATAEEIKDLLFLTNVASDIDEIHVTDVYPVGKPSEQEIFFKISGKGLFQELEAFLSLTDSQWKYVDNSLGPSCRCRGEANIYFLRKSQRSPLFWHHKHDQFYGAGTDDKDFTDQLSDWFVSKGYKQFRIWRDEEVARERHQAELARGEQALTEIIPADLLEAIRTAGKDVNRATTGHQGYELMIRLKADAFIAHEESPLQSAKLYFRILGGRGYGVWDRCSYYDTAIKEHLLPRFTSDDTLATAALSLADNQAGTLGASRWFFALRGWEHLREESRQRVLTRLAEKSLEHPRWDARAETMLALQAMGEDWARDLLLKVLHGGIHPPPHEDKFGGFDGLVVVDGDMLDSSEYTDMAIAAFCLAQMGDVASRHRVSELLENEEKGLSLLTKALSILDMKK